MAGGGGVRAGLEQELLGRCWHSAGLFPGGNCLSHISTQPRKFTQVRQTEYNTKIAKKKQTSKDNNEKTKERKSEKGKEMEGVEREGEGDGCLRAKVIAHKE